MQTADFFRLIAAFFVLFSAVSVVLTVYDKRAARRHRRRVPERTLFLVGLLGGAVAEYITMRIIHHKTLHKKFMIGLPLIAVFQAAAVIAAYLFLFR